MNLILISGMINSALYLTGVFVVGIVTRNPGAWKLALATAALCYLTALVQVAWPNDRSASVIGLVLLTIIFGAAAGIALLIR